MARSGQHEAHEQPGPPLSAITGSIYETVDRPELWPRVLADLARLLDSKSGLIRSVDMRGHRAVLTSHYHNLDQGLQAEYRATLVGEDPYLDALARIPTGRMVTNEDLFDLQRMRRTDYYQKYLGPLDNHFITGGFVERDDEGRHTVIGFQRHRRAIQFDRDEVDLVQALVPHIRRATHLERILRQERQRAHSAETALDSLCLAACLLDREGRLLHANARGERLLRNEHGLRLREGRVVASCSDQAHAFADLLAHGQRGSDGRGVPSAETLLLSERASSPANLLAIVVPLRRSESTVAQSWPGASVALYIGDLEDTGLLHPDVLCAVYGLTPAEARLAVALGRGRDLPELADDWLVSVETLRTQLKGVFAKSGTRRQTDLVRLLAGAPWKLADHARSEEIAP